MRATIRIPFVVIGVVLVAAAPPSPASESDLTTWIETPANVPLGTAATVTVHYSNLGPSDALYGYLNAHIVSGLPAPLGQLTDEHWNALLQSAQGTDTHGNTPTLHLDTNSCEGLFFQLQGPQPPGPMQGLEAGGTGSFSFDLPVPMEGSTSGQLVIRAPAHLARHYLPVLAWHQMGFNHHRAI